MEFTPPNAPVVILLFLFTAILMISGGVAAGVLAFRGRRRPRGAWRRRWRSSSSSISGRF